MDSMNQAMDENISEFNNNIRLAWILLIIGLIATASAAFYVRIGVESDIKRDFDFACNEIRLKIDARLNAHAQILRSGAALFDASDNVTREQWHLFTMHQRIEQQLPGIQGIGFSLLIPHEQSEQHIQEIRSQGFPEYHVRPEGEREFYTSIIYLEPFSGRNLRAFGYDMLTEPVRRAAMERARDADAPVLSGKVTLIQETGQDVQAGTLMYVPVYRRGMPTNKIEQRRAAIYGWVYSPYRMKDLMKGILGGWDLQQEKRIRFQIFDGEQMALLYDSQPDMESDSVSVFSVSSPNSVVGRRWTLRFIRTGAKTDYSVWLVISAGTLISLLMFGLIISLFNTRFKARKIAEQLTVDLRESKLFALSILDALSAHIAILDNKGTIIKVNRAWREFAQANSTTASDLCEGSNYIAVCEASVGRYSEEAKEVAAGIRSIILDEQKKFMLEYPCHSSDEKRWFNLRMTCFKSEGGIRVVSAHENITKCKLAEEASRESEKNFRTFFNTIDHLLFVLDNTGNIIRINDAVEKRLGFTEAELLGKNVLTVHPEDRRAEAGQIVFEMLEGKRNYCSIPLLTKDGKIIPAETRVIKGCWSGKEVIFGVSKDISDIKASEEKFSKIFYSNPSAMAISDFENGRFTDVNNILLKTLGYERDELIGKTSAELGLFVDSYQRASLIKLLSEQGELKNYEVKVRRKSGDIRYGLFSAEILSLQSRKLLLTMMDDITERKQAEQEMFNARQAAEAANRAKSEFLASMSHELRTPLTGVLSLSEALIEEAYGKLNEKQLKALRSVESSGQHLLNLITDILDLSKIEAGQMEVQIGKCSISDICQSALQLTKGMANKKQHKVSFSMNPASISIDADPMRLKQMLVNLLSNAIKFTPEGGKIALEVRGDEAGHILYLSVKDTGIGIVPEMFHKLFKPFVQLDSSLSRRYSGTGLGLSLVRRMAELHGGSVTLESEVGRGSCFTISLPWKTSVPDMPDDSEDKSSDAISEIHTSQALILLVEDNEVNICLYLDYLESKGYRVAVARTGRDGVEKTAAFQPDLILMDIQMPDMDGLEATRIIRADANPKIASTPIIALTSLAMPGDMEKCIDSGADEYLSKPVHLSRLSRTIENFLNKRA